VEKLLTIPTKGVIRKLDERFVKEPEPSIRSEAERDRDRVLYSSALLRLAHVTQVAAPEVGHTFHSRLTHSMKVAQVARGLAHRQKTLAKRKRLDAPATQLVACLNEDATEAAALAHDLGHPPFGHLAEQVLQRRSKEATFEGNAQSFRIVTRLALRSVAGGGLNLTRRTLNGLLKYPWLRAEEPPKRANKWGAYDDGDSEVFAWARKGVPDDEKTLEASLMDWADDITYAVHDMDDFYRAGLIPLERLTARKSEDLVAFKEHLRMRTKDLAKDEDENFDLPRDRERLVKAAEALFAGALSSIREPYRGRVEERVNLRQIGSDLIGRYIAALELRASGKQRKVALTIDDDILDQVKVLKQLTWFYVINRPSLSVIQRGQTEIIDGLYTLYQDAIESSQTHIFPSVFADRLDGIKGKAQIERVVIDLIAGLTETSASEIYKQKIGVSNGSLLMPAAGPV
jgi:dGTPase